MAKPIKFVYGSQIFIALLGMSFSLFAILEVIKSGKPFYGIHVLLYFFCICFFFYVIRENLRDEAIISLLRKKIKKMRKKPHPPQDRTIV